MAKGMDFCVFLVVVFSNLTTNVFRDINGSNSTHLKFEFSPWSVGTVREKELEKFEPYLTFTPCHTHPIAA